MCGVGWGLQVVPGAGNLHAMERALAAAEKRCWLLPQDW